MIRMEDWLSYILIASYIYVIPAFSPLPTSPITLFTVLALGVFIARMPKLIGAFKEKANIVLSTLFIMFFYHLLVNLWFSDAGAFDAKTRALIIYPLAFLAVSLAVGRFAYQQVRFELMVNVYVGILTLSMIWYLLTTYIPALFLVHAVMYDYSGYFLWRGLSSGLVANVHSFGYHLVPLGTLLIAASIMVKGPKRFIIWGLLGGTIMATVMVGERSVLLAVATGTAILLTRPGFRGGINLLYVFLALVGGLVLIEINIMDLLGLASKELMGGGGHTNLLDKLGSDEFDQETGSRFVLQWKGFLIMLEFPLGLIISGKQWGTLMLARHPDLFASWGGLGMVIPVHNGYLVEAIEYGLITFIMTVICMVLIVVIGIRLLRSKREDKIAEQYDTALGAALIGNLPQAMFHNGSFVNSDQATILLWLLGLIAYSRLVREKERNKKNIRNNRIILNQGVS